MENTDMIGRKHEIKILEDCLNSSRPEFLAIYGRRRVGKTFLIKEFFDDSFSFYATGVNGLTLRKQLKVFNESLIKYGCGQKTIPGDWFEAFARLEELLKSDNVQREYRTGKRIVFIDEMPWMDSLRSDFKSALDYFWNSWGSSQKDLVLIVCGSATSWIINNIISDTGGFYNRITQQIHLMPFSLNECRQLLQANGMQMSEKQIIESYMIFGGIPYYLNYLKPYMSLAQNVEMLFFKDNSPLRNEFYQLFASLFRKSDSHIRIVRALSEHRSGMLRKELLETGAVKEGKELTRCLNELEQCGFIRRYKGWKKDKSGYYFQLVDSLSLFHLNFIETGKVASWIEFIGTPGYYAWGGFAFERVCLLHTDQIKNALGIRGISSQEYAWSSKASRGGAQIDLLIDRKDDVINICEIKFSDEKFYIDEKYSDELIHKREIFRRETGTSKALMLTMITVNGVVNNEYKNIISNEVTADDLFAQ